MMRLDVLETESDSIKDTMDCIRRDIESERRQVSSIERQEDRVKGEIQELNVKLDALSNHKQDYLDKYNRFLIFICYHTLLEMVPQNMIFQNILN